MKFSTFEVAMRVLKRGFLVAALAAAAVALFGFGVGAATAESSNVETHANVANADGAEASDVAFEISPDWPKGHYARIETYAGRIVARLLPEQAPQAAAHFAAMAEGRLAWTDPVSGERKQFPYYDGIPIRHVQAGLLFETGDWTTTGKGGPRLYAPQEGFGPVNFSSAGCFGMARVNRRISAVQFFVTAAANPHFNNVFPCFAKLVEGQEVVFQISQIKAHKSGRPLELPVIDSIHIFKVGDPLPLPIPRQIPQKKAVPQLREDLVEP